MAIATTEELPDRLRPLRCRHEQALRALVLGGLAARRIAGSATAIGEVSDRSSLLDGPVWPQHTGDMHAIILDAQARLSGNPLWWTETPILESGPGRLLIKVTGCGVCRSNLHVVEGDRVHGGVPAISPIIPGHEVTGTVTATGDLRGMRVLPHRPRAAVPPAQDHRHQVDQISWARPPHATNPAALALQATSEVDERASHERGLVAQQPYDCLGDFFGFAAAFHR